MKEQKTQKVLKSKRRVIAERMGQLALVIAGIVGIGAWQTRNMTAVGEPSPSFQLTDLDGNSVSLKDAEGKKTILYFFAPWCSVCGVSSHNINALREAYQQDELAIFAVGLGWDSVEELKQFAKEHALTVPVLIGTEQTSEAYRISAFPSVYILDEEHRIAYRSVGYTTELGLRIRTSLAGFF
jgi:peroxiredoxin